MIAIHAVPHPFFSLVKDSLRYSTMPHSIDSTISVGHRCHCSILFWLRRLDGFRLSTLSRLFRWWRRLRSRWRRSWCRIRVIRCRNWRHNHAHRCGWVRRTSRGSRSRCWRFHDCSTWHRSSRPCPKGRIRSIRHGIHIHIRFFKSTTCSQNSVEENTYDHSSYYSSPPYHTTSSISPPHSGR
jgi:hypothetical protein